MHAQWHFTDMVEKLAFESFGVLENLDSRLDERLSISMVAIGRNVLALQ